MKGTEEPYVVLSSDLDSQTFGIEYRAGNASWRNAKKRGSNPCFNLNRTTTVGYPTRLRRTRTLSLSICTGAGQSTIESNCFKRSEAVLMGRYIFANFLRHVGGT